MTGTGDAPTLQWRAVWCKPRAESRAALHLRNQGFEVLLPLVRATRRRRGALREMVEPMFPRYLFAAAPKEPADWTRVRSTRGAIGLVRFGEQIPAVPASLVSLLIRHQDAGGVVELTAMDPPRPGDRVEITTGALAGLRGLFAAHSGADRVLVLLELLGSERTVTVPGRSLRRVPAA